MKPLRIAFDVDGVFADMEGGLRRLLSASTAREVNDGLLADSPIDKPRTSLSSMEQRRVWAIARRTHNFWETLDEIEPGVLARLDGVSRQRRWHVVFLTQRPRTEGEGAQLQTQRWLQRHGFESPSVLVVPGERGQLANTLNLDYVIDDLPGSCLNVMLESSAAACLIWRSEEASLPPGTRRLGIDVFRSVAECLDRLEAVEVPPRRPPRMFDRIRRALQLSS